MLADDRLTERITIRLSKEDLIAFNDAGQVWGFEPSRFIRRLALKALNDIKVVRAFKIRLNDSRWSSNDARAKGLRALAVAQLGSKGVVDGREFVRRLAEQTIRQIVPLALRAAASRNPKHGARLEAAAVRCEQEGTRAAALEGKAAADADADAADAADAAADAANTRAVLRDRVLTKIADIALGILRELNAPGVALWDAVNAPARGGDVHP